LCLSCGGTTPADNPVCGDGFCETPEDEYSCPDDCLIEISDVCGDDICGGTESSATCPEDCSSPNKWLILIIWLIVILILIGVVLFLIFRKRFSKKSLDKNKTPSSPPPRFNDKPSNPPTAPTQTRSNFNASYRNPVSTPVRKNNIKGPLAKPLTENKVDLNNPRFKR
jgi:hypothetical protein